MAINQIIQIIIKKEKIKNRKKIYNINYYIIILLY